MGDVANELESKLQSGSAPGETSPPNDVLEDAANLGVQNEPKKRGRGRPPKSEAQLEEQLNMGDIPTQPKPESAKRGPKPGARKTNKSGLDASQLGKQLVGLHTVLASLTGIATLNIAPEEGESLAKSIVDVCNQYDLAIDGKTGAFLGLAATAAMIYGPRYFIIKMQMDAMRQQAQQQQQQPPQGYTFDHVPTPGNFTG